LGLPTGVPVILGAGDSACAALAGGLLGPGMATVACGSTDTVAACSREPLLPEGRINVNHAVPGRYLSQTSVSSAGLALEWVVHLLYGRGTAAFARALREAGRVPPGAGGVIFLPYLQGERTPIWDADARGVFVGLSAATERGHCVRAVLEGIALALRHNVEDLEAGVGTPLRRVTLVGGGARGMLLNRIRADVLGRSVRGLFLRTRLGDERGGRTRDPDEGATLEPAATSAAGAAVLGAVGVGLQPSFRAAVAALKRTATVLQFRPRPRAHRTYQQLYRVYTRLYPALRESFAHLRSVRQGP